MEKLELYLDCMNRGNTHKSMAEGYEKRDERILARMNYLEALKWYKRAKDVIDVFKNKRCYEADVKAKIEKYARDVKYEYDNCIDKIKQLNGIHHLNTL